MLEMPSCDVDGASTSETGEKVMNIKTFWHDVLSQNREALPDYFDKDAVIRWHCTNEKFNVQEYIKVNCEYPGEWDGKIERIEEIGETIITVVLVFSKDQSAFFHVVSFAKIKADLICELDEYWADDGKTPVWRRNMRVGTSIK